MGKPLENGDDMGINPDLVGGFKDFLWLSRNSWEFHDPNWPSYFSEG